jgi:hypothetical protein
MCASCGCGTPDDNHGDPANITIYEVEWAAAAAGISPDQVVDNLKSSL